MNKKVPTRTVTVRNPQGLHARPADLLVRMASSFQSTISIGRDGEMVDCSILSLLTLGRLGTVLTISADGSDAEERLTQSQTFSNRVLTKRTKCRERNLPSTAEIRSREKLAGVKVQARSETLVLCPRAYGGKTELKHEQRTITDRPTRLHGRIGGRGVMPSEP